MFIVEYVAIAVPALIENEADECVKVFHIDIAQLQQEHCVDRNEISLSTSTSLRVARLSLLNCIIRFNCAYAVNVICCPLTLPSARVHSKCAKMFVSAVK